MGIALGVLGWSIEESTHADPAYVWIGYEAKMKHEHKTYQVIMAASGVELGPYGEPPKQKGKIGKVLDNAVKKQLG